MSVVVVCFLAAVSVRLYLGTDHARRLMQTTVNRLIPGKVHWADTTLSIFEGAVALRAVRIEAPDGRVLISADRLSVDIDWVAILNGVLGIETVRIEKPAVRMQFEADGSLDLVDAFVTETPETETQLPAESVEGSWKDALPFNITVGSFELTDGLFHMALPPTADRDGRETVHVEAITITGHAGDLLAQQTDVDLHTGSARLKLAGLDMAVNTARLATRIDGQRLADLTVRIESGQSVLTAKGEMTVFVNTVSALRSHLEIALDAALSDIRQMTGIETPLDGRVDLNAAVNGPLNNPSVSLSMDAHSVSVGEFDGDRASLTAHLKNRLLDMTALEIKLPQGTFSGTVKADFRNAFPNGLLAGSFNPDAVRYDGNIHQIENGINAIVGDGAGIAGTIAATLVLQGKGLSMEALDASGELTLTGRNIAFPDLDIPPADWRLKAAAELKDSHVSISQCHLVAGDNQLSVEGGYALGTDQVSAAIDLVLPEPGQLLPAPWREQVAGALQARFQINGATDRPEITGRVTAENLQFRLVHIRTATADVRFTDGMLRVDPLVFGDTSSRLVASGRMRVMPPGPNPAFFLTPDPEFLVTVQGEQVSLEAFFDTIKGNVNLAGRLSGTLSDPRGRVELTAEDIDSGFQSFDTVQLNAEITHRKLVLSRALATVAPEQTLHLDGWLGFDRSYDFHAVTERIDLNSLNALGHRELPDAYFFVDVAGSGTLDSPSMRGRVGIGGLALNGEALDRIVLDTVLLEQRLTLQTGRAPNQVLPEFKGVLDLASLDFNARVNFRGEQLGPLFRLAGREDLSGSVTGGVVVNGNAGALQAVKAGLDISDFAVRFEDTELISGRNVKATLQDRQLTLLPAHLALAGNGSLDIKGVARLSPDEAITFSGTASGYVPLTVGRLFTDELPDIEGGLRVDARLSGTPSNPDFRVELQVADAAFTVPEMMRRVEGLSGRIVAGPSSVTIEALSGTLGNGDFVLNGVVGLDAMRPEKINIQASAHALPLQIPETAEAVVNVELALTGTAEKALLKGDVLILEGLYYKDVEMNLLEWVEPSRGAPAPSESEPLPFFKSLAYDVHLTYRNPFMVDNNMALLAVKPDLRLYGTYRNPLMSGRAAVDHGSVTFRKKSFDVEQGVIDFINPYKIDPEIDVKAVTRIRDWTIRLTISGTTDNLKYALSSDPAETDADILSLLVFGKTARELTDGGSGSSATPAQLLTAYLAGELGNQAKEAAGIDLLEVEYVPSETEGEADRLKVTVGKELSRRVSVKYGVETQNGEYVSTTTAEYKFLEELLMRMSQDSKGNYGGEVSYRIEFR